MAVNPDILREMDVPSDAIIETWDSITAKTVILGRQILDFCEPEAPQEVYDLMAAMPRGAYHPVNILSRAFGYGSTSIIHPSISSYRQGGSERTGFRYGDLPAPEIVEGRRILVVDEVCDSGLTLEETEKVLIARGAKSVATAVLHYKPTKSENDFVPDFYVAETDKWVVYPWELYEHLGARALAEEVHSTIWLPDQAAAV
jgi:hypoxanthine phosphoribosyltransferase